MKDTELYAKLLGLDHPWSIAKVELDLDKNRVDLWLKDTPGVKYPCAKCGKLMPVYDHTEVQVWRHLNT